MLAVLKVTVSSSSTGPEGIKVGAETNSIKRKKWPLLKLKPPPLCKVSCDSTNAPNLHFENNMPPKRSQNRVNMTTS